MIFRNLDANNDWTFGNGKNDYLIENNAIKLNIKTRTLSWLNDCFFALDEGIDWTNRLGSKNQEEILQLDLKKIILDSDDVVSITSSEFSLINRKFTATFFIDTIFSKSYKIEIEELL